MTSEQSLEGQGGSGGERGAGLLPLPQKAEPSPSVGTKPGGDRKEDFMTVQAVGEPQESRRAGPPPGGQAGNYSCLPAQAACVSV